MNALPNASSGYWNKAPSPGTSRDSSAAYVENWLKQLKNDKTLIVYAAAQAQKAADFILGRKFAENGTVAGATV